MTDNDKLWIARIVIWNIGWCLGTAMAIILIVFGLTKFMYVLAVLVIILILLKVWGDASIR